MNRCLRICGWLLSLLATLCLASCGSSQGDGLSPAGKDLTPVEIGTTAPAADSGLSAWPPPLPKDGVQPWETLDSAGIVQRESSVIDGASEFAAGVERFSDGVSTASATVSERGEALRLSSGASGSKGRAFATYRLPLGGSALGAVSVDVNRSSASTPGRYYLGLANFGTQRWDWYGPFTENNVRLAGSLLPAGDYTSAQGNVFITMLAYDGAAVDVVGVAVNPDDAADTTAPPVPGGLSLSVVDGGVEAVWNSVVAMDLAGYRIYYSNSSFSSPGEAGVSSLPSLQSLTRAIVSRASSGPIFVAVRAVDTSGNQSALSAVQSASISTATLPSTVKVTVDADSALRDGVINLSCGAGYTTYELDLDGNGVYETSNSSGSASVDSSGAGMIRANVRATTGTTVAYGGISVIILANSRPTCSAAASNYSPRPDQTITLIGDGEDAEDSLQDLAFDWDVESDGLYDFTDQAAVNDVQLSPGLHNVKLRVTDSQGAWDVDTITINVSYGQPPVASLIIFPSNTIEVGDTVQLGVSAFDFDGDISAVALDLDSSDPFDFETSIAVGDVYDFTPVAGGDYPIGCKATDAQGVSAVDFGNIHVKGMSNFASISADAGQGGFCSLADVGGRMAFTYYDSLTDSLIYMRAKNSSGTQFDTPFTLATGMGGIAFSSLTMISGHPAVAYTALGGSELRYRRASDATGTAWGVHITLANGTSVGNWCSLKSINGHPAVAYDDTVQDKLYYIRASDTTGGTWNVVDYVDNCSPAGSLVNLLEVNGLPAVAYRFSSDDHLVYIQSTVLDSFGSNFVDLPDIVGGTNPRISMKLVNGRPAIAYEAGAQLKYLRALGPNGTEGWETARNLGTPGALCSLEVFNGLPLIAYYDSGDDTLRFQQANEPEGYGFSPWSYSLTMGDATSSLEKQSIQMQYVNGRLSVLLYAPAADLAACGTYVP